MKDTDLIRVWIDQKSEMLQNPAQGLKWIKKANSAGEYFLAMDIAEGFLGDQTVVLEAKARLTFQQQWALALARAGFIRRARSVLEQLRAAGAEDGETMGLFGSIYKALSTKAPSAAEKTSLLETSRDYYRQGFIKSGDTYCGINAAALCILLDETEDAKKVAGATRAAVEPNNDYWDLATLAEADLIEGRLDEARAGYRVACAAAGDGWANIASTRKQCRLLCQKIYQRSDLLDECFPSGAIGCFIGHMLDAPNRPSPRFPASAVTSVAERISAWVKADSIRFTYSSAASGGDILFLEAAQAQGAQTNIILPFAPDYFVKDSVAPAGEDWVRRFAAVMENANSVRVLNEDMPDFHASSYDFTNRMISARAASRAAAYDLPVRALAVWNGQTGDSYGGTADGVAYWARGKIVIDILNPTNSALDSRYDVRQSAPERPFPRIYTADPNGVQTDVVTLLHLHFPGYQDLREKDFSVFVQKLIDPLANKLVQRSWYPARYGFGAHYLFAWTTIVEAGLASLEFQTLLQNGIAEMGTNLQFSLCLHTAPLQLMVNQILNQYTHEGAAVARLLALSNQLQPRLVYATEPFADLTAFEKIRDFSCEYSGTVGVGPIRTAPAFTW